MIEQDRRGSERQSAGAASPAVAMSAPCPCLAADQGRVSLPPIPCTSYSTARSDISTIPEWNARLLPCVGRSKPTRCRFVAIIIA